MNHTPVSVTFSGQFQVWSFSARAPNKVVSDRTLPSHIRRVEAPQWCNVDTVCERSFERQWEGLQRVERKCLQGSRAHQGVRKVKIGHEMFRWLDGECLVGSSVLCLHYCEKLQFLHVHYDPLWAASMETIQGASATSVNQLWSDSSFSLFFLQSTRKPTPSSSEQPSTEVDADSQSFPGCGTGSVKVVVAHKYSCELQHH